MAIEEKDRKDRLGDKLRDAERGKEDQYFAERDRKLIEQMRRAKVGATETVAREAAHMHCPKCGARLETRNVRGVSVDECPSCHGMWLAHGELEQLQRHEREEEGWIARWLRLEFPSTP